GGGGPAVRGARVGQPPPDIHPPHGERQVQLACAVVRVGGTVLTHQHGDDLEGAVHQGWTEHLRRVPFPLFRRSQVGDRLVVAEEHLVDHLERRGGDQSGGGHGPVDHRAADLLVAAAGDLHQVQRRWRYGGGARLLRGEV